MQGRPMTEYLCIDGHGQGRDRIAQEANAVVPYLSDPDFHHAYVLLLMTSAVKPPRAGAVQARGEV
jgi:hypothetical protein